MKILSKSLTLTWVATVFKAHENLNKNFFIHHKNVEGFFDTKELNNVDRQIIATQSYHHV